MSDDEKRLKPGYAPTPFTADEMREGSPPGHVLRHRIEATGKPSVIQEFRVVSSDADWCTREGRVFSETGEPLGEPKTTRAAWIELRAHASFPEAATEIAEERIGLPAGEFDCLRYTVTEGSTIRRFWFAKTLPGMPAKIEITDADRLRMRMELVEIRQDEPSASS